MHDKLIRREIRVFISSTFRDMMEERDLLVKEVFPALRQLCASRFVTITEIDLRWGITEEQASENKVLPICLDEIQRSRPFFIGILGERYGWVPLEIPQALLRSEPWLQKLVNEHKSVTELEIMHGVLNAPEACPNAFFYFRASDCQAEEMNSTNAEEALAHQKLVALKERIRQTGLPLLNGYKTAHEFAERVRQQLTETINRLFPEDDIPNIFEREHLMHEAMACGKCNASIPRPLLEERLNALVASQKNVVVHGVSGCGKSTFLANWLMACRKKQLLAFSFLHFFGAAISSSAVENCQRRLLYELKEHFGFSEELPEYDDELLPLLKQWLWQIPPENNVVLVFDALNQMTFGEGVFDMERLVPSNLPPNIRVVASATPGEIPTKLLQNGWQALELPLFDAQEVKEATREYIHSLSRSIDERLLERIVQAPETQNPLYLRTVLNEMRQYGEYETLSSFLDDCLQARDIKELFKKVILRWHDDFVLPNDGFTKTMQALCVARHGISENELMEIIAGNDQSGIVRLLPRAQWTPLFLAMVPHMAFNGGLLTFGHDDFRQAACELFAASPKERHEAHCLLAGYFELLSKEQWNERVISEMVYQLFHAGQWQRLAAVLATKECILQFEPGKRLLEIEYLRYWEELQSKGVDLQTLYEEAFSRLSDAGDERLDEIAIIVSSIFHQLNFDYELVIKYAQIAVEEATAKRGEGDYNRLANILNLANYMSIHGYFEEALGLLEENLAICQREYGATDNLTLQYQHEMARDYAECHDTEQAEALLAEVVAIREKTRAPYDSCTLKAQLELANILSANGKYSEAVAMARDVYDYKLKLLGKTNPETMYAQQVLGWILGCEAVNSDNGDYDAAIAMNMENLEAKTTVFGAKASSTLVTMGNLISVLMDAEKLDDALSMLREFIADVIETFGKGSLNYCRAQRRLVEVYLLQEKYDLAHEVLAETIQETTRGLGEDHFETLDLMELQAELYWEDEDYDAALPLYRQLLEIYRSKLEDNSEQVVAIVRNLTICLINTGTAAEAFNLQFELANEPNTSPEYECSLGCFYKNGIGTGKNKRLALYWLQKALAHGFQDAQGVIDDI